MSCRDFRAEPGVDQPGEQDCPGPADQPGESDLPGWGPASSGHLLVQRWKPPPRPVRHSGNQATSHKLCPFYYIEPPRFVNLKSYLKVCLTTHVRSFFVNDTGVYTCISHNIAGSVARFIDLQYEPMGKPHFILSLEVDINIKQFPRTKTRGQLESNPDLLLLPPVRTPDHVIVHSVLFQETQSKIICRRKKQNILWDSIYLYMSILFYVDNFLFIILS